MEVKTTKTIHKNKNNKKKRSTECNVRKWDTGKKGRLCGSGPFKKRGSFFIGFCAKNVGAGRDGEELDRELIFLY